MKLEGAGQSGARAEQSRAEGPAAPICRSRSEMAMVDVDVCRGTRPAVRFAACGGGGVGAEAGDGGNWAGSRQTGRGEKTATRRGGGGAPPPAAAGCSASVWMMQPRQAPGWLPRLGLARRATWRAGRLSKRARPFAALRRSSTLTSPTRPNHPSSLLTLMLLLSELSPT